MNPALDFWKPALYVIWKDDYRYENGCKQVTTLTQSVEP